MKIFFKLVVLFFFGISFFKYEKARALDAPQNDLSKKKESDALDKTPRSIFLLKRAKLNSDVGGPRFYPAEAQLRTIINDPALHNIKKYE